jgi:hypothetical protein
LIEEFNQESRVKNKRSVNLLLNQVVVEFSQGSNNRRDLCIGIEGDSKEVKLSQGIPKEELLKTLEDGASFNCKS